jgi:hypothetical protein
MVFSPYQSAGHAHFVALDTLFYFVIKMTHQQMLLFFICSVQYLTSFMHCFAFSASRQFSRATALTMSTRPISSALQIVQLPCLNDNYGYLIHDETTGDTAAVDTPDASAYKRELERRGWKLTHIFNTHQ